MGLYADVLGEDVKMSGILAEATRVVLGRQGGILAPSGFLELSHSEVVQVLGILDADGAERDDHPAAGKYHLLRAWLSSVDCEATLCFG